MSDLDSYAIRGDDEPTPSRRPQRPWWQIAVVVLLLLAIAGYFYFRTPAVEEPEPAPAPAPVASTSTEPVDEPEPLVLPPLAESDFLIRDLVSGLSSNPDLAAMLIPDNLVRRFAATVVNIAQGTSPRNHVTHLAPKGRFQTTEAGGKTVIDVAGYHRYDLMVTVFDSLDAAGTAELYRNLKPLLQESYQELGYPAGDFDEVLSRAIGHLLDVPAVEGRIGLVPTVKGFDLADPTLQDLSDAQKHLLRMGPESTRIVQGKLADIVAEIGLSGETDN